LPRAAPAALLLLALVAACGSGGATVNVEPTTPTTSASTVSGGLTVTLLTSTTAPGASVGFVVTADETHARGALGYRVSYGDGTSDQNVVPLICIAGAGSVQTQVWQLSHHYASAGAYRVTATVTANCTADRATASLPVTVN
jgi:hypothetical protein